MNGTTRRRAALLICFCVIAVSVYAQDPVGQNPPVQEPGTQNEPGALPRPPRREPPFSIKNVQLGTIYSSQNIPAGITTFRDPFPLGSSGSFTASGVVQWMKPGRQSFASVVYMPGYQLRVQNGTSQGWNQSLSLLFNRRSRNSKWQFFASGEADMMSFDEALLSPSKYTRLVSSDAGLDALSGAVLQGNTTDPTLANTSGFQPDNRLERGLFGNRTAFAGGQIGVHASPSRRLTVSITAGTSDVEHLRDSRDTAGFIYPSVTSVSLGTDVTYSKTPHSTFGAEVNIGQSNSTVLQNTSSMAHAFYKERLRRYWFFEASGGAGRNSAASAGRSTYIYSGGTGFESSQHTLMVSFSRNITDAYVIAFGPTSAAFTTVAGAWQWHPKRAGWYFVSDFAYYRDAPPHQPPPHTWQLTDRLNRKIGRAYAIQVESAVGRMGSRRYIQDGKLYHLKQNALRVSFVWYPSARGAR
jgi:hypothetical protein